MDTEKAIVGAVPDAKLASIDWDAPGALSIVVQGGLFQGNMVETANHCHHWRALFPRAEIVLALSVTDVVVGHRDAGLLSDLRLAPRHVNDGHLQFALQIIVDSCDRIALGEPALPLPPIKNDSPKLNNMNLQIAAAKAGLALATGRYVLRIRSDMVFLDRSFIDQYSADAPFQRGDASLFKQRVMVSWLYTLNPYTVERMPLHFSDWFHFGLTQDVRRIWDVPAISLADSLHFRVHKHAARSNNRERQFNIRIAVEQHVLYHCFKPSMPALVLDYVNDVTSIRLAMDILVDNFVVCDLVLARCIFDKYSSEFFNETMNFHCVTREDWTAMVQARDVDYRTTLAHKISAADSATGVPAHQGLPRTFGAGQLLIRDGTLVKGEIVSSSSNGLLFFGPYATLDRGRYVAIVNVSALDGVGVIILRVMLGRGKTLVATQKLSVGRDVRPEIRIPFDIRPATAAGIEVLCMLRGDLRMAVSGLTIAERSDDEATRSWSTLLRGRLGM